MGGAQGVQGGGGHDGRGFWKRGGPGGRHWCLATKDPVGFAAATLYAGNIAAKSPGQMGEPPRFEGRGQGWRKGEGKGKAKDEVKQETKKEAKKTTKKRSSDAQRLHDARQLAKKRSRTSMSEDKRRRIRGSGG